MSDYIDKVQVGGTEYDVKDSNLTETVALLGAAIEEEKADKAGVYPDMTSGSAEQLLSGNVTENKVPYKLRQTGGNGADRVYLDKVVGGTVGWNQVFPYKTGSFTSSSHNFSVVFNGDGLFTFTVTAESTLGGENITNLSDFIQGHKYLFITDNPLIKCHLKAFRFTSDTIFDCPSATYNNVTFVPSNTTLAAGTYIVRPSLYDLTAMFGSTIADYLYTLETATAGAGVAKLKEWGFFTEPYYAYNAGELISVGGVSERKTVGFNQWDEEWESGLIAGATGQNISGTGIRSVNYCRCIGNTDYYFKCPAAGKTVMWYDADKGYINGSYLESDGIVTSPANAAWFRLMCDGLTTYSNNIILNFSDPARNGTYEPYNAVSYAFDSDLTLRGIPKLDANNQLYFDGDEYKSDGSVKRRFSVYAFTGSEAWTKLNDDCYYANPGVAIKRPADANSLADWAMIPGLTVATRNQVAFAVAGNDAFAIGADGQIYITANVYTNKATLLTSMVYELATPTTEQADPFAPVQAAGQGGTEEFVSDTIVPVGHVSRYPENARAKLDGLPADFSTLIAPTEKAYKATQAYSSGSLFIVNNILYKATASIANGATITPGTNCTATTLAAVIAALN